MFFCKRKFCGRRFIDCVRCCHRKMVKHQSEIPFAIGLIEPVVWRKKVIWGFQAIGLSLSLYLLHSIVGFPVISEMGENMVYVLPYVREPPAMDLYLAATCIAPLFSSHNFVRLFGVLTLLLSFAALWFYTVALFSIWCFFSAILSVLIYLHFRYRKVGKVMGVQLNSWQSVAMQEQIPISSFSVTKCPYCR